MRRLTDEEVSFYLAPYHFKIGTWGQVCDASGNLFNGSEWINHPSPEGALKLYSFSHQILRWLTLGAWAVVQIDNSTCFDDDEDFLVGRLLFGAESHRFSSESRSFLFEFDDTNALREQWLLGDFVYMMFLFGGHCQIVSAGSKQGQHLSVQDGYVYFLSKDVGELAKARDIVNQIQAAPLKSPPH